MFFANRANTTQELLLQPEQPLHKKFWCHTGKERTRGFSQLEETHQKTQPFQTVSGRMPLANCLVVTPQHTLHSECHMALGKYAKEKPQVVAGKCH